MWKSTSSARTAFFRYVMKSFIIPTPSKRYLLLTVSLEPSGLRPARASSRCPRAQAREETAAHACRRPR
eukprot:scaffold6866_cov118-Isochrysis_galbana.AAC.10